MTQINYMSVAEFRRLGYLQEVNRRLLHPLGLALSVNVNEDTGEETFGPVWDYRDDPEGIRYDDIEIDDEFCERALRIGRELTERSRYRFGALNYVIQKPCEKYY